MQGVCMFTLYLLIASDTPDSLIILPSTTYLVVYTDANFHPNPMHDATTILKKHVGYDMHGGLLKPRP